MWSFLREFLEYINYAADEKHRRQERAYWQNQTKLLQCQNWIALSGVVIATIAAGGAVFAAFFAGGAYHQSQRQAIAAEGQLEESRKQTKAAHDSLIQANRAWLDVYIDPGSIEISWKDGRATFSGTITATDQTASPALQTNEYIAPVVAPIGEDTTVKIVADTCNQRYGAGVGSVTFQKSPLIEGSTTEIARSGILDWRLKCAEQIHAPIEKVRFFNLMLVACVIYKVVGDESWRHTARVYYAGELGADGKTTLYVPIDRPVRAGAAWIRPALEGNDAN